MDTKQKRRCAYCCKEKDWIWSGKRLKDGSKIYVDHNSARWAGRRCSDCEKQRVRTAIKLDRFKRTLVIDQLEKEGYSILSKALPMTVEKNGQISTVGIQFVAANGAALVTDQKLVEDCDLYAFIFETVRLVPTEDVSALKSQISLFSPIERDVLTADCPSELASPAPQNHYV